MEPSPTNQRFDVIVVGGGIVGLATAWRLIEARPDLRLALLEKESSLARHQTSHNSGVLHAGLYYRPGSEKAQLSVRGLQQIVAFCEEHHIAHEQCGKIVVATDESELDRLHALFHRGAANGLKGLRLLDSNGMREIEPEVAGVAALHVPQEGIVDFPAVAEKLGELISHAGGEICLDTPCQAIVREQAGWRVSTTDRVLDTRYVVACAGLHSDRLVRLSGKPARVRIVPFRGQYFLLKKERQGLVRHLIYPVPDPSFPFLGVHFTRLVHGGVEAGPNAVLALAREGYRWTDINPRDLADAVLFPGLWRFLARYPAIASYEIWRSLSKRAFCRSLQRLVPAIREADLEPGGAGVRAQAMSGDGSLVDDFSFVEDDGILHVINAPSPAATASLAIGERLCDTILQRLR